MILYSLQTPPRQQQQARRIPACTFTRTSRDRWMRYTRRLNRWSSSRLFAPVTFTLMPLARRGCATSNCFLYKVTTKVDAHVNVKGTCFLVSICEFSVIAGSIAVYCIRRCGTYFFYCFVCRCVNSENCFELSTLESIRNCYFFRGKFQKCISPHFDRPALFKNFATGNKSAGLFVELNLWNLDCIVDRDDFTHLVKTRIK